METLRTKPDVIAEFIVEGLPAPQGSKQIRQNKARTKVWLTESAKTLKPWREQVATEARSAMFDGSEYGSRPPYGDAVCVALTFVFPRPKSVPVAKRPHHIVKPDVDKLSRAILDALTGTVIVDDARVVTLIAHKRYQHQAVSISGKDKPEWFDAPGVIVRVTRHV